MVDISYLLQQITIYYTSKIDKLDSTESSLEKTKMNKGRHTIRNTLNNMKNDHALKHSE